MMQRKLGLTLAALAALFALADCASPLGSQCQATYTAGTPEYRACLAAAERTDAAEVQRRVSRDSRSKE